VPRSFLRDLVGVDDPTVLYAEWAKYAAWRAIGRLQTLVETLEFTSDVHAVARALEGAVEDVQRARAEMLAGAPAFQAHYERPVVVSSGAAE
jgi:hypothetical protein